MSALCGRLMRTGSCFALVFSLLLLFGVGWAQQPEPKGDSKPQQKEIAPSAPQAAQIGWIKYDAGLKLAKKEGKKVFVEFTAKWCGYCKKMQATTFKDPTVIDMLNKYYVTVSVDGDSRDSLNVDGWITSEQGLAREYRVTAYPTFWFLTPEAEPIAPIKGYRDAQTLADILDYLKDDIYKTVQFEDFLKDRRQTGQDKNK